MTAVGHCDRVVLMEHSLSHVKASSLGRCSYRAKLPREPHRHENQIPYFEVERWILLYMLRFIALY